ncbi:mucin-5AC-like [Hyalella azteca]|uniref:Mucin-5AC-like n=1 Tax=Hyalella azteca TaxID=294128 RepID=A0A979FM51_HYAAZ|nr:mucin-5AC-like [Hyalella azteca]
MEVYDHEADKIDRKKSTDNKKFSNKKQEPHRKNSNGQKVTEDLPAKNISATDHGSRSSSLTPIVNRRPNERKSLEDKQSPGRASKSAVSKVNNPGKLLQESNQTPSEGNSLASSPSSKFRSRGSPLRTPHGSPKNASTALSPRAYGIARKSSEAKINRTLAANSSPKHETISRTQEPSGSPNQHRTATRMSTKPLQPIRPTSAGMQPADLIPSPRYVQVVGSSGPSVSSTGKTSGKISQRSETPQNLNEAVVMDTENPKSITSAAPKQVVFESPVKSIRDDESSPRSSGSTISGSGISSGSTNPPTSPSAGGESSPRDVGGSPVLGSGIASGSTYPPTSPSAAEVYSPRDAGGSPVLGSGITSESTYAPTSPSAEGGFSPRGAGGSEAVSEPTETAQKRIETNINRSKNKNRNKRGLRSRRKKQKDNGSPI